MYFQIYRIFIHDVKIFSLAAPWYVLVSINEKYLFMFEVFHEVL